MPMRVMRDDRKIASLRVVDVRQKSAARCSGDGFEKGELRWGTLQ